MMSSKNNGFTASDIERYHSGKMLPEERHALEKAALDDPFLADALEGYAFTSTPTIDLAKIQSKLDEKRNQKKVVPIFQKYKWLSAAAIILIVAGAGWFAYNISRKENKASITAMEKKMPANDSNRIVTSPQTISHDSVENKTAFIKQKPKEKNQAKTIDDKKIQIKTGWLALQPKDELNNSNEKQVIINNNNGLISRTVSVQNEVANTSGRSQNNQRGYAKMNNAVLTEPRLNNASNNALGKELFYKKADNNNADAAAKVRDINTNDTITNLNIVLKPLPGDSLKEIVVGYGTQKKSTDKYPHVIIDTLEPAEGYVHFDDYVASNLKIPEELKTKTISGEVQLSFDVDKDGKPTNIAVVKSLCDKCDEEAIRLLKEGPKWKKGKNKKGKITIKF